ncbi:hypothetical protein Tco_0287563 [Tanacetum coccineum]
MAKSSNKVNQCISEQILTQKKKILGIDQLPENTSSSGPKDLVFVKFSADNSNMSITSGNKPRLSEAEDFTLPNLELSKDKVTNVPIWVKIYKVYVVAYSEDGLSLIASQIADIELKKEVTMAVPIIDGEGHTKEHMVVEYEWNPIRCVDCKVFGHAFVECPKRVVEPVTDTTKMHDERFTIVRNRKKKSNKVEPRHVVGIKLTKPKPNYVYRRVEKGEPYTTKVNMENTENKHTKNIKLNDVVVKNSFSTLGEGEDSD